MMGPLSSLIDDGFDPETREFRTSTICLFESTRLSVFDVLACALGRIFRSRFVCLKERDSPFLRYLLAPWDAFSGRRFLKSTFLGM